MELDTEYEAATTFNSYIKTLSETRHKAVMELA